jgi:hypothetical protein
MGVHDEDRHFNDEIRHIATGVEGVSIPTRVLARRIGKCPDLISRPSRPTVRPNRSTSHCSLVDRDIIQASPVKAIVIAWFVSPK